MRINFVFLPLLRFDSAFDCGQSCQLIVSETTFQGQNENNTAGVYDDTCRDIRNIQSYYQCMRNFCNQTEISAGVWDMNQTCIDNALPSLPAMPETNFSTNQTQPLTVQIFHSTTALNQTANIDQELFDLALRTITTRKASETARELYGFLLYAFWAVIILIGMIHRGAQYLALVGTSDTHLPTPLRKLAIWTKRYFISPALFTRHVATPVGWCTIPTRLQSITIALFVAMNIVVCAISYDVFGGNLYWPNQSTQFWRYLSDRTGVIGIANIPLVFVFAMRNNVILWITGWSNATFKQFHRWVARIATIEAVIHSVGFSVLAFQEGGISDYFAKWIVTGWRFGVIATVSMLGLCIFSLFPIRRHIYEFFLIFHVLLAMTMLIGMWFHVERFGNEYRAYVWPCVAVWVFDRVTRAYRVITVNFPFRRPTASYDAQTNMIRLNVPINSSIKPRPGAHYYIYMLQGGKFMESHPFTLSSWTTRTTENNKGSELSFVIRPYDGFTGRLRDMLQASRSIESGDVVSKPLPRMLVEGPYGTTRNFEKHDSILFIIGGFAITVALSYLRDLAEAAERNPILKKKSIKLVWVLRDLCLFQDVLDNDIEPMLRSITVQQKLNVQFDIYITSPAKLTFEASPSTTPATSPVTTPIMEAFMVDTKSPSLSTLPLSNSPRLSPSSLSPIPLSFGRKHKTRIKAWPIELNSISNTNSPRGTNSPPNPQIDTTAMQVSSRLSCSPRVFSSMFSINTSYRRPAIPGIVSDYIFTRGATPLTPNGGQAPTESVWGNILLSTTPDVVEKTAKKKVHKMAIVACGTPSMADDTRAAVVDALGLVGDGIDLDYFPEMFGW